MRAVICDIDGTLAEISHRLHFLENGRRDWDGFFSGVSGDAIIGPVKWVCGVLRFGARLILCSGRPERCRVDTVAWLDKNGVEYHSLHMRPDGDHRSDTIVKSEMLDAILAAGNEVMVVIDDRPSVVEMWRARGLMCLDVGGWDERQTNKTKAGLLTLMIGPSGAGKSTFLMNGAASYGISLSHVVSSDQIRTDLCGDFRDQTRNEEVFAALHATVRARVAHGLPAVVDATNLRRKDRLACVDLAPHGGKVRYIVIDRPMEEKRRDAGWRAELGFDLLAKHQQTFNSQIKEILAGDGRQNVEVVDLRT